MSLFRNQPADADLPMSVADARQLRALVREAFANAGREVTVNADHVVDDQGMQFGLWNLAALCAHEPRKHWPALVADHVRVISAPRVDADDLDDDQLTAMTYLRLVEAAAVPDQRWHPTAPWLGSSLRALLSIDLPDEISTPTEEIWQARGGIERWRRVGRANIAGLAGSLELQHGVIPLGDTGAEAHIVQSESFLTASLALALPELAGRYGFDLGRGALVTVPFRHQLAFFPVQPGTTSAMALDVLFRLGMSMFADSPGPLSPHVFLVRGEEWLQLTRIEDDQAHVDIDQEVAAALGF
ncbi:hypothetical protein [Nocardioides sp.]|uniref:hypothetical protein n=1 Tax=Nocardioides sp. TaxID=35761 RepID=UPI0039E6EDAE